MPDREKVIKGMQESAAYFRSSFDAMYGTVACEKFRNWTDAIEQAIALLRAQEPRVMTLDEVRESKDPIMREVRGIGLKWATYYTDFENYGEMICRLVDYDAGVDDRYASAYGVYWRCWTARPSDEQMEAVKWDD